MYLEIKVFHSSDLFYFLFGAGYWSAVWFFRKERLNLECSVIMTEGGKSTAI